MKKRGLIGLLILSLAAGNLSGLDLPDSDETICFLSTSAFSFANIISDPSPDYYTLSLGVHLTEKDVLILEAITWRYDFPLGIPYGEHFDDPDYQYPGYIRDFGAGLTYQRFFWKGFYSSVHIIPLFQRYISSDGTLLEKGFQLYTTLRLGYHFSLFKDSFFIEPAMAFNYWPIRTKGPQSFTHQEADWPDYFLFEPSLNLGWNF